VRADVDDRTVDLLERQLARYQQIIGRLAGNSVQVKTWCFTASAALAALAIDRDQREIFAVTLVLVGTFFYLDSYYLALERHFRRQSSDVATRVATGEDVPLVELVTIAPADSAAVLPNVLACGVRAKTSAIYAVVAVGLAAGLVFGPS